MSMGEHKVAIATTLTTVTFLGLGIAAIALHNRGNAQPQLLSSLQQRPLYIYGFDFTNLNYEKISYVIFNIQNNIEPAPSPYPDSHPEFSRFKILTGELSAEEIDSKPEQYLGKPIELTVSDNKSDKTYNITYTIGTVNMEGREFYYRTLYHISEFKIDGKEVHVRNFEEEMKLFHKCRFFDKRKSILNRDGIDRYRFGIGDSGMYYLRKFFKDTVDAGSVEEVIEKIKQNLNANNETIMQFFNNGESCELLYKDSKYFEFRYYLKFNIKKDKENNEYYIEVLDYGYISSGATLPSLPLQSD